MLSKIPAPDGFLAISVSEDTTVTEDITASSSTQL